MHCFGLLRTVMNVASFIVACSIGFLEAFLCVHLSSSPFVSWV